MYPSFFSRKTALATLVSLACGALCLHANELEVVSYSYSKVPHTNYPDASFTKLTDGEIVPDTYAVTPMPVGAAVGWLQNPADPDTPNPAIVFDLGELKYVDEVAINYVLWPGAGVRAPNEVIVSYSSDGEEFILPEVRTGFDGSDHPFGYDLFTRNLALDLDGRAARYVRLDIRQGPGETWGPNRSSWHWVDEVAFSGREIDDVDTAGNLGVFRAVELEFPTEEGTVYQIQSSHDLQTWEPFGVKVLGNGETYRLFASAKTKERGFFRVQGNQ